MKSIKAKKNFEIGGKYFFENDEVHINNISIIKTLNEKGFIEPLTLKEIIQLEKEINKEAKSNGKD